MSDTNILKVCNIDYGCGNVKYVFNLISSPVDDVLISNAEEDIRKAYHLILPGVGSFGSTMERIRKTIPIETLEHEVFLFKNFSLEFALGCMF